MPKDPGVRVSTLARAYTRQALRVLVDIMKDETKPPGVRCSAANMVLDRGWGKSPIHQISVEDHNSLLKVVNEIVHVHETREQVEFRDQTPLLELAPDDSSADSNGSKKTH